MDNNVSEYFVVLDLRSINDGFPAHDSVIESALEQLPDAGIIKLIATETPPLITEVANQRKYRVNVKRWAHALVEIEILGSSAPDVVDLTGLEAPGPMEKILSASAKLAPQGVMLTRVPRVPVMLFPHLQARNLSWNVHEEPDQTALLMIRKET